MAEKELYIGVMSGTSLDGVDVALIEIDGQNIQLLSSAIYPMPESIKQNILDICTGQPTHLPAIGRLDHRLGHLFADAVNALLEQSGYQAEDIRAIGCHGQTVYHHPDGDTPFTMQLGDAHIVATKTGIDTVADFRRKDMALGGQGAPLVPAFHRVVFPHKNATLVVLNIGGIANISVIRPEQPLLGYDTGPGNILMDAWCQYHTQEKYDQDAQMARSGHIDTALLELMKQDRYFSQRPPKSTGREYFNLDWVWSKVKLLNRPIAPEDVQRTLCRLTAETIADQSCLYASGVQPRLFVCGGGANNPLLMQELQTLLKDWLVSGTSEQGVDNDYMEAMAFAWLAYQRIHELPSNVPEVTGATQAVSLGVIYTTR
ncbi:Anhydro-N-acetylmuramic acid kinase [Vibrio ruber DSM 16370]|uniref:Anhydro-N-acetylmuramic acid kinase n=1 Tax=Vibrio ruber (strain DSM 16370 / JCM 11486 / BCRC 17186 / CECT 7878 / LMG 23124 / VR1) TaxID=1123498 RepID=A0A1R4LBS3_VIBR1|nr:anhydro-N-acetylmuramic acid kinase [Vibrio ruber]SJN53837.1 Anhydro-N-acetylmuramic acid kinase [Vibrio ruber DSM 16370]